jgi:hypothetical protein
VIELPNGTWVDPCLVKAVRIMEDRKYGPRTAVEWGDRGIELIEFDNAEYARAWTKEFGRACATAKEQLADAGLQLAQLRLAAAQADAS